jgi:hypothetical protein
MNCLSAFVFFDVRNNLVYAESRNRHHQGLSVLCPTLRHRADAGQVYRKWRHRQAFCPRNQQKYHGFGMHTTPFEALLSSCKEYLTIRSYLTGKESRDSSAGILQGRGLDGPV